MDQAQIRRPELAAESRSPPPRYTASTASPTQWAFSVPTGHSGRCPITRLVDTVQRQSDEAYSVSFKFLNIPARIAPVPGCLVRPAQGVFMPRPRKPWAPKATSMLRPIKRVVGYVRVSTG